MDGPEIALFDGLAARFNVNTGVVRCGDYDLGTHGMSS
jgi:hypothetical protein